MRLIVTGGLGYIGSPLLASMPRSLSRDVLVIDSASAQECRSRPLPSAFNFIQDDIRTADLDRLISGADVVVHLAAIVGAAGSDKNPDLIHEVNADGTRRVAEACLRADARLLFISTTSVYASPKPLVDEHCDSADIRPQTPYAASKLQGERIVQALGQRGLRYAILRFGSAFGASVNMRLHTAINRFCWQACTGEPLTIWRTAHDQCRPYLHVDDAVHAIQFVVAHNLFGSHLYNVVSANATIGDILNAIRQDVPSLAVRYIESSLMNDLSYAVAAEQIRRQGFTPQGDLTRGIRDTIEALRHSRRPAA